MTKKRFLALLTVMFLAYTTIAMVVYAGTFLTGSSVKNLDDAWDVTLNGKEINKSEEGIYIKNLGVNLKQGDEIVYQTILRRLNKNKEPSFMFRVNYCAYRVYLGDELIAERYIENIHNKRFIGTEQRIVPLPHDYDGKVLRVELYANAQGGPTGMVRSSYGQRDLLEASFLQAYMMCFASGVFLILFGGIYLFIIFFMAPWFGRMKDYIPMAVLCVVMGVFLHTRYCCTYLLMDTEEMSVMYGATLFLIIPLGIACARVTCKKDRWKPLIIAENVVFIASVCLLFAHVFGWIHIYDAGWEFGILATAMYTMLIIRTFRMWRYFETTKSEKLMLAALFVVGMLTLFSFMLSGFIMSGLIRNTLFVGAMECNIFSLGPSFFGYFLLLDFLMNISDVYSKRQEYDSLEWLAYSDGLTGIANRAKYTQYLSELEKKKTDYCIISMDLDGLKKVNDAYGHECGDKLLLNFSEALKEVFADDFVARIGGDEFAAILADDEEFQVEEIIRELRKKLEIMNEEGRDPWIYSVSAGYAYRHESNENYMHQTYLLADQRMYEEKKMRKEMNEMKAGAYQNV